MTLSARVQRRREEKKRKKARREIAEREGREAGATWV